MKRNPLELSDFEIAVTVKALEAETEAFSDLNSVERKAARRVLRYLWNVQRSKNG